MDSSGPVALRTTAPDAWERFRGGKDVTPANFLDWRGTVRDALSLRPSRGRFRRSAMFLLDVILGRVASVPVDACTNPFAYRYGGSPGWHYYDNLARELLEEPEARLEDTTFHEFIREIRAPSLTDMLCLHDPVLRRSLPRLPYGSYPWGTYEWDWKDPRPIRLYDRSYRPRRTRVTPRNAFFEFVFYEKSDGASVAVRSDFEKMARLVKSFRQFGYRPLFGHGYFLPTAGMLVRESGEVRFLLKEGNHRTGVFSALGADRVWLRTDPRFPPVRESQIDEWPYVRAGLVGRDEARRLFSLYFELDGSERARALGLEVS